jgi:hypothetical protein
MEMTSKQMAIAAGAVVFTALNLTVLALNLSAPVNAEGLMNPSGLYRDRDFRYAVQEIIESCKVKGDTISCKW